MEPRDRIIGPVATPGDDQFAVDFGDLVRKLVLFEEVIVDSYQLKEFPLLIQKFGYDGVTELLNSRRVRIRADAGGVAAFSTPPGLHDFGYVVLADRRQYMHEGLMPINAVPGLRGKQAQKLRKLVAESTILPPDSGSDGDMQRFLNDLYTDAPVLKQAVALTIKRELGRTVDPGDFLLHVEKRQDGGARSETDLSHVLGLDDADVHELVSKGLLGVAGLAARIDTMERYQGLGGFQVDELPLFEAKLGYFARQLDPAVQLERFGRVLDLAHLPDASPDPTVQDVDLARLVEIASTDEAREFRAWLRSVDSLSDPEVEQEISKLREQVRHAVHSATGKVVRFAVTTALSIAVPPVAFVEGAFDSLVLDRLVREPGPTAFLSRLYPTVFRPEGSG